VVKRSRTVSDTGARDVLRALRTPPLKEAAQKLRAFRAQYPADGFRPVVEALIRWQEVEPTACSPRLRVGRTEKDAFHTGVHDGPGTHDTGLQGNIEPRSRQTIVSHPQRGIPQGQNLRMRRRIHGADGPVPSLPDDFFPAYQNGAYRHLALPLR